jgi:hypothetical protein
MQKLQLRIRSLMLRLRLTAAPLMHQAYTTVQSSHSLHRVALAKIGQWRNCRHHPFDGACCEQTSPLGIEAYSAS